MTNKITDKVLRDLIMEVMMLNEEDSIKFKLEKYSSIYYLTPIGLSDAQLKSEDEVRKLAKAAGVPDELLKKGKWIYEETDPQSSGFNLGKTKPKQLVGTLYSVKKPSSTSSSSADKTSSTGTGTKIPPVSKPKKAAGAGPGDVEITHPVAGKIRATKLDVEKYQKVGGHLISTDFKPLSSLVLYSVYDADLSKNIANGTNDSYLDNNLSVNQSNPKFEAALEKIDYKGNKLQAPVVRWSKSSGPYTEDILKKFLHDLGDALSSGGVKKQYSIVDLPSLFAAEEPKLLIDFETSLASIFNLDVVKKLTEVQDKLEIGDFDFLFDNFEVQYKLALKGGGDTMTPKEASEKLEAFRNLLVDTYGKVKTAELKKALVSLVSASKATGSARSTMGTSSGYRITSRSASGGSVDAQIIKAFDNAFSSTGTFSERVDTFNKYMAEINEVITSPSTSKVTGDIKSQFSKFIVLDLLQQILYDFEASSAGWVFESWLAFMGFGSAIGAGYGAGDFTIQEGGKTYEGSAKLLQKGTTSQNFENVEIGQTIKYVIGIKQTKVGDKFQGTTQKDRVGKLDIYLVDITKKSSGKTEMVHNGEVIDRPLIEKGRIDISIPKTAVADATLELLFLQDNEFQDISGIIVTNMSEKLSQAMNTMSSLKANIDEYVLSFDKSEERQVYSDGARNDFNSLSDILKISQDDQIFGVSKSDTTFQEGKKITANFLKKLISESFKK